MKNTDKQVDFWETLFADKSICAMVKRRYERLQLRSAITTQNM